MQNNTRTTKQIIVFFDVFSDTINFCSLPLSINSHSYSFQSRWFTPDGPTVLFRRCQSNHRVVVNGHTLLEPRRLQDITKDPCVQFFAYNPHTAWLRQNILRVTITWRWTRHCQSLWRTTRHAEKPLTLGSVHGHLKSLWPLRHREILPLIVWDVGRWTSGSTPQTADESRAFKLQCHFPKTFK